MIRFVHVQKAAKKKRPAKGAPDAETVMLRAADGTAPHVSVSILDAIRKWSSALDAETLRKLVESGALDKLDMNLPWPELEQLLAEGVRKELVRAVKRGADSAGSISARAIRSAVGVEPVLTFDGSNPRVERYIQQRTAQLVTRVSGETRAAIKQAVDRMMKEEVPPVETFRAIKRVVGLDRRRENALANYEAELRAKGAKGVRDKVDRYAEKLLKDRTRTIARTETMDAVNQGQLEGTRQARDAGLFGKSIPMKQWVVTDDDRLCPTCSEMAGVEVPLDGKFTVRIISSSGKSRGTVQVDKPPVHPNCRCVHILTFDGEHP